MTNHEKLPLVQGSHWVSETNFDAEVAAGFDFPTPLGLIDSTLRKARYTAGATTDLDGFLRIAAALDEVGVKDESLNINYFGERLPAKAEWELAQTVLAAGFGFTTNVYADTLLSNGVTPHARTPFETVDALQAIGARVVAPGVVPAPTAEAEVRQLDELERVVAYARECGLGVTLTFAQAGRRDIPMMLRAADVAIAAGVHRIDLMDSTSSLHPEAMKVFVKRFRAGLAREVPLTMHPHDDFGMGTASAIAAASVGAAPDVSVNGVSYRCGFAALEEVVTALEVLYGVDTGIRLDRLTWLCQTVAKEMGVQIPALKAISGEYAFLKHTPGDVLTCLRAGPMSFPPVSGSVHAEVVGAHVRWVWDTLSTPAMVRLLGVELGLELSEQEITEVYDALDTAVRSIEHYPRWLERPDVEQIVTAALARSRVVG